MTLADQIRDLEARAAAADAATATLAKVRALLLPTAAPAEPDDLQAVAESIDGALQKLVDAGRVEAGAIDGRCLADRADDLRAYVQDLLQDLECARAARDQVTSETATPPPATEEKPPTAPASPAREGEGFVITRVNSRPTPHRVFFHLETKTWTPYAENATGFSTREEALAARPNRSKVLHTTELAAAPAAEDAA